MSDASSHASPPADDEIDLGRLFDLLLDHKWLVIGVMGAVYALLATPIYRARWFR